MLVGGRGMAAASPEDSVVINLANERIVGEVTEGEAADIDVAFAAATEGLAKWSRTSVTGAIRRTPQPS
jgi:acyl-CoA reductase-like NAD-dependent aldehyde dehydrogenase